MPCKKTTATAGLGRVGRVLSCTLDNAASDMTSCRQCGAGRRRRLFDQTVAVIDDERPDLRSDVRERSKNALTFIAGHQDGRCLDDVGVVAHELRIAPQLDKRG